MDFELSDSSVSYSSPVHGAVGSEKNELSKLLTGNGPGQYQGSPSSGFSFRVPLQYHRSPRSKGKKKGRKNKEPTEILNVLAAQTLKIASINGLGELDKLENDLEEEIRYDNKCPASTKRGRFRHACHHRLHSKFVLFVVVALNIIDCILVMAELTLDFHHVSHLLQNKEDMVDDFTESLAEKYEPLLKDLTGKEDYHMFQAVLDAFILWGPKVKLVSPDVSLSNMASQCVNFVTSAANYNNQSYSSYVTSVSHSNVSSSKADQSSLSMCFQPFAGLLNLSSKASPSHKFVITHFDKVDKTLITVAHKLHYISIAILTILVALLCLKIIVGGKRFFRSRMQVFDGVVVMISFIIDLVFIEGLTIFQMQDFVIILTFLLPWRILRVLNSLIVAVLDKQRLNLKIIYTQKKKISRNLTEVNNKVEVLQRQIQVLQGLCSSRGIQERDVRKVLGTEKSDKKGGNTGGGLASMMALGKLAFQAADALAPMPNDFGGSKCAPGTPTTPVLLSPFMLGNALSSAANSPSTSTPTTPDATRKNNNSPKITTTATVIHANGTGDSFNGNPHSNTMPNGNANPIKSNGSPDDLQESPETGMMTSSPSKSKVDGENLSVSSKSRSLDDDGVESVGTDSEDLADRDEEDVPGTTSTSQATLNSCPGALDGSPPPPPAKTIAADGIAIQIEDVDEAEPTTVSNSPSIINDSVPTSPSNHVGDASDDKHINADDATSKL